MADELFLGHPRKLEHLQNELEGGRAEAAPPPPPTCLLLLCETSLPFGLGFKWGCGFPNLHDHDFPVRAWNGHYIRSGLGAPMPLLPQCANLPCCISVITLTGGP